MSHLDKLPHLPFNKLEDYVEDVFLNTRTCEQIWAIFEHFKNTVIEQARCEVTSLDLEGRDACCCATIEEADAALDAIKVRP